MEEKRLVIMRGLPWTGKSFRAKQLLEEAGKSGVQGVIFSTDEYWYSILKPDKPDEYSFNPHFLADAHRWNRQRAQRQIELGHPLIIIDNTNTTAPEPHPYVVHALHQDYKISIEEPTSERWHVIRELLLSKRQNSDELKKWAAKLAEGSKETHNVPQWSIEKMMWRWQNNLTVDQIVEAKPFDF